MVKAENPRADMWKGIAAAVAVVFSMFVAGGVQSYVEATESARQAEALAQRAQARAVTAHDRAQRLRSRADSLQRVAELRHPETLWLARVIYSETNRPHEMYYVAWVVRNRVENHFRGKSTYRSVALDPKQFSAFNRGRVLRQHYMTLNTLDVGRSSTRFGQFKSALHIAHEVRTAPAIARPFHKNTMYFYSQVSMPGHAHAPWVDKFQYVHASDNITPWRFRFYKDPQCRLCGNRESNIKYASNNEDFSGRPSQSR
jgi:hypothetical protein